MSEIMVDIDTLNSVMNFEQVVEITERLGVAVIRADLNIPEARTGVDGTHVDTGWTLVGGYSGQHGYSGPVMHSSEYIGGRMADDFLKTPGIYAAVIVMDEDAEEDEDNIAGWAVARLNEEV